MNGFAKIKFKNFLFSMINFFSQSEKYNSLHEIFFRIPGISNAEGKPLSDTWKLLKTHEFHEHSWNFMT